jgi:hypothetical protein
VKKVPSPSRIRAAEQDRRLWIALGISLGIHALLLTLHFQSVSGFASAEPIRSRRSRW